MNTISVFCVISLLLLNFVSLRSDSTKITINFKSIDLIDNVPELSLSRFDWDGPIHRFQVDASNWCRSQTNLQYVNCTTVLNKMFALNLMDSTNDMEVDTVSRIIDVYSQFTTRESSVCICGAYSANFVNSISLLNPLKTVSVLADSSEHALEYLQLLNRMPSMNNVKVIDVSTANNLGFTTLCDVVHLRGDIDDNLLRKLIPFWRVYTVILAERLVDADTFSTSMKDLANVKVNWVLKSTIADGQLLVGYGRLMTTNPFEEFRMQKALDSSYCSDHCRYYQPSDSSYHYKTWDNAVNARLNEKIRQQGYSVYVNFTALGRENTDAFSGTTTNPAEVLLFVTFSYNGEPVVPLQLESIYNSVDGIIITEARMTHSGKPKECLYIHKYAKVFEPFLDKIQFLVIDSFPSPPEDWHQLFGQHSTLLHFDTNPNKSVEDHYNTWFRETHQRDIVAAFMEELYPDNAQKYILIVGDADEIVGLFTITPESLKSVYPYFRYPYFVSMEMFYYNFNFSTPPWFRCFLINNVGLTSFYPLSAIRMMTNAKLPFQMAAWHLSYFSSVFSIVKKIESFAHIEYDMEAYKNVSAVAELVKEGLDLFGRGGHLQRYTSFNTLPHHFQTFNAIIQRYQDDRYEFSHLLHATIWITVGGPASNKGYLSPDILSSAYGVEDALKRIGFRKVSVVAGVNLTEYRRLYESGSRDFNEDGLILQVVMGNPDGQWLLPNYLLLDADSENQVLMSGACGLLSMKTDPLEPWVGIPVYSSAVMPAFVDAELLPDAQVSVASFQYIDVLYLGDTMGSEYLGLTHQYNILTSESIEESQEVTLDDAQQREHLLLHSKVVVVSRNESSVAQPKLISYLRALGKAVVVLDEETRQNPGKVSETINALLMSHSLRESKEQESRKEYEALQRGGTVLRDAVFQCLENSVYNVNA